MKNSYTFCRLLLIFGLGLVSLSSSHANPFSIQGRLGLFYDMYNYSAFEYAGFRPRYPSNLGRFSAQATISAGAHFQLPFGIDISTRGSSYYLPNMPEEGFIDYVQNPRNNIHMNPSYKWIQGFIGTQSPNFTSLTTGDIPIFGLGLSLNPGRFLFSVHYGKSQLAVNPDPLENIAGAYGQRILAARAGYGDPDGTMFMLNVVRRKDDITSLDASPAGVSPVAGVSISPLLQVRISESLLFSTETAGSVFTSDINGPPSVIENDWLVHADNLININGSSYADFSNISSLEWRSDNVGIGAEVRYIGPGFQPVGYRTMETDVIDYNLKTDLSLFDQKVQLNGSGGLRTNNIHDNMTESSRRFIANLSLFTQLTESFSVLSTFANFGFNNNAMFDTLKVEMVHNSYSFSPTFQINGTDLNHMINLSAGLQDFDEFNVVTGDFISMRSVNYSATYNLGFVQSPLNFGVTGMYLDNESPVMGLRLYHLGVTARYSFMDRRIRPSLTLSHAGITREGFTTDARWRLNLKTSYHLNETLDVRFGYNLSYYEYGSSRPEAKTTEHRLQLSVAQSF